VPPRIVAAALWPFGIALTSWDYLWRTTPLHRRERLGSPRADSAPPLPAHVDTDELQPAEDGVGPLFHRRYRARIQGGELGPEDVMARMQADLNVVAPTELARFVRPDGEENRPLAVGDELVVRMPGPWDGPVRVVDVTPTSFRFATLDGHLEAGQIEFRARTREGDLVFTIESWARSGDRLSKVLYGHLRMAKEVQLHMWTSVLERVARVSKGRLVGGVDVDTRVVEDPSCDEGAGRPLGDPRSHDALDALHDAALNFDADDGADHTPETGWVADSYRQALPSEPPGPPVPGYSWETAVRLSRRYELADPDIVRAVYYPDRPLEDRDMLLVARFHGLRFRLGVRVTGVRDETITVDGDEVRVWGWGYRTLKGHLEMGQIRYEVWKWLDTGAVEFRVTAYSRRAPVANPVVVLGLRLFGRREQVRFARIACARMAALTKAELDDLEARHA